MSSDNDYSFNLLTIGETNVGKTTILQRFTDENFKKKHISTFGIDYKYKVITVDNQKVSLKIWDTAGQERFHVLTINYFNKSDGILLVYDVTDKNSFTKITDWMKEIHKKVDISKTALVLVGNKIDSEREVSTEEGIELAKDLKVRFFETSAFENINISECFHYLASKLIQMKKGLSNDTSYLANNPKNKNIKLNKDKKHKKEDKCFC